jgi:hypothetical protein
MNAAACRDESSSRLFLTDYYAERKLSPGRTTLLKRGGDDSVKAFAAR